MQVALTFEEPKQRALVPKQVVGLAAALLTGASLTPMNMQSVQGITALSVPSSSQIALPLQSEMDMTDIKLQPSENLRTMEEKAGAQTFSCLNVCSIALIEARKEIQQMQEKIVSLALTWQGIKYQWGGRTRAGVDCSGLVQRVFLEHGISLPRTSYEQFRQGVGIPKSKLEAGDLVFFNTNGTTASHVGIYVGNGEFISATKNCVDVQPLASSYWAKTYSGSRRVL